MIIYNKQKLSTILFKILNPNFVTPNFWNNMLFTLTFYHNHKPRKLI